MKIEVFKVLFRLTLFLSLSSLSFAGEFSDALLSGKLETSAIAGCKDELIKFYKSGHELKLKTIEDKIVKTAEWIQQHNDKDVNGTKFYHYTSYQPAIDSAKKGDVKSIFQSLKMRQDALRLAGNVSGVLWVAGDKNSSKPFGNWLLTLSVEAQTNIFPYDEIYSEEFQSDIKNELQQISPLFVEGCRWFDIALFWLEDSGVDLIYSRSGAGYAWFTLIDSTIIKHIDVSKKN